MVAEKINLLFPVLLFAYNMLIALHQIGLSLAFITSKIISHTTGNLLVTNMAHQ